MKNIFVFTAGNADARSHLDDSIINSIPSDLVYALAPESRTDMLRKIEAEVGGFYAWGAEPGPQNQSRWHSMYPEDLVFCVYENRYHFVARVMGKMRNATLAERIWGRNESSGQTWEFMYFLTKPEAVSRSVDELSDVLNNRYMGFTRIGEDRTAAIFSQYGSLEAFVAQRVRSSREVGPRDDLFPVLRRYLRDHIVFRSPAQGSRYLVDSIQDGRARLLRLDGGEEDHVDLSHYAALRKSLEPDVALPLRDLPGSRIRKVAMAQAESLALTADGASIVVVDDADAALALLVAAVRELSVSKQGGEERIYKPAMLAAVLEGIHEGHVKNNRITFDAIVPQFLKRAGGSASAVSRQQAAYAFFHLASEPFWMLAYRDRAHATAPAPGAVTPSYLMNSISHATLKGIFWNLLQKPEARAAVMAELESRWLGRAPSTEEEEPGPDLAAVVHEFAGGLTRCGLGFGARHQELVRTFIVSLATKRFALLTGLSGSGKTQIALRFGEWLGGGPRVLVEPVRPDWTGPEPLLGYEDGLRSRDASGRPAWMAPRPLRFMLSAARDPGRPHLLILDEMNLAHVERYFADVLSGMESEAPCIPNLERDEEGVWRPVSDGSERIPVPPNLLVVGTVNVDETTYMFSPKVLDRANTFEFRVLTEDLQPSSQRPRPCEPTLDRLVAAFLSATARPAPPAEPEFYDALRSVHRLLLEGGFEFGHRVFFEAGRFAGLWAAAGGEGWHAALDLQILQKVLPRLHGARRRLEPTLCALGEFCATGSFEEGAVRAGRAAFDPLEVGSDAAIYPRSLDKVQRMTAILRAQQFASFTG
ncbi:MAG: hypothetical protein R3E98_16350 [Gemmatimonadota bacterium]